MKSQKRIKMKKAKKRNVRSEAAQREAIKAWIEGRAWRQFEETEDPAIGFPTVEFYTSNTDELIAIFDLRDCYRKRQPLKGFKKAISKAIQPKRKK